LILNLNFA
jgi:hypothetical protein